MSLSLGLRSTSDSAKTISRNKFAISVLGSLASGKQHSLALPADAHGKSAVPGATNGFMEQSQDSPTAISHSVVAPPIRRSARTWIAQQPEDPTRVESNPGARSSSRFLATNETLAEAGYRFSAWLQEVRQTLASCPDLPLTVTSSQGLSPATANARSPGCLGQWKGSGSLRLSKRL